MGKVLITGATGFIGNHVTRLCLERGDDVRVMVMPGEDRSPLDGMDVEFVEGNLLDPDSLVKAVNGVERLYHLAALFAIWTKDPDLHYKINVEGARAMMEAAMAAGVEKVVAELCDHENPDRSSGERVDRIVPNGDIGGIA